MPCAARRHRTPLDALADSAEAVIYFSGAYLVTTAAEADDLAAAGVPFARVTRRRHRDPADPGRGRRLKPGRPLPARGAEADMIL